jgi:hypothetical protein
MDIKDLGLSTRTYNALRRVGITESEHLADTIKHKALVKLINFGAYSYLETLNALKKHGLINDKDLLVLSNEDYAFVEYRANIHSKEQALLNITKLMRSFNISLKDIKKELKPSSD